MRVECAEDKEELVDSGEDGDIVVDTEIDGEEKVSWGCLKSP